MTFRLFLSIILLASSGAFSSVCAQVIEESQFQNRPHYEIRTHTAIWMLDRAGGGFSSIIDSSGVEWIGFKPGDGIVPESAASDFRGMPNLVFRGKDNGAGHPGFEQCISVQTAENQITCSSVSGLWKWKYTFSNEDVHLEILQTDSSRAYWFLYEGIPGGRFDPLNQYWGNNVDGKRKDAPAIGSAETANGNWNRVFFGHINHNISLFIEHLTPDLHNDTFSYMGASDRGIHSEDGMVVFGFGRRGADPLLDGLNHFRIGFQPCSSNNIPIAYCCRIRTNRPADACARAGREENPIRLPD